MLHTDLEVYKLSLHMVKNIYDYCRSFPKQEEYGLTSQMKRAAISVPSNIAEGCCRNCEEELIRFLDISLGSLNVLDTHMEISKLLGYCSDAKLCEDINSQIDRVRQMTINLKKSIARSATHNA
jgi:four helix bundle protein